MNASKHTAVALTNGALTGAPSMFAHAAIQIIPTTISLVLPLIAIS